MRLQLVVDNILSVKERLSRTFGWLDSRRYCVRMSPGFNRWDIRTQYQKLSNSEGKGGTPSCLTTFDVVCEKKWCNRVCSGVRNSPVNKKDTTSIRLERELGGDETPALLFTASHGVEQSLVQREKKCPL
jgi:hypothetical protein